MAGRWTEEKAAAWWRKQQWPLGVNYVTSDAVNSVEMWMKDTFHPRLIEKELRMASDIGYNSVRVFLSFTVWNHERGAFLDSFEAFLGIAEQCSISVLPILFDDCAFDGGADPVYGRQPDPVPGVHNSRWVPSPGFQVQDDPALFSLCGEYLHSVMEAHRNDARILAWDLYNEPGNTGRGEKCLPLLRGAFAWARDVDPDQPLTAGIWRHDGPDSVNGFLADHSDVISLHAYTPLEKTKALVAGCRRGSRPVFITEWLHRPAGSAFADHLPYFREEKIGAWQWGMIVGKTQTNLHWQTMNGGAPDIHPAIWQHDIVLQDGTPYDEEELRLIRRYSPSME